MYIPDNIKKFLFFKKECIREKLSIITDNIIEEIIPIMKTNQY